MLTYGTSSRLNDMLRLNALKAKSLLRQDLSNNSLQLKVFAIMFMPFFTSRREVLFESHKHESNLHFRVCCD